MDDDLDLFSALSSNSTSTSVPPPLPTPTGSGEPEVPKDGPDDWDSFLTSRDEQDTTKDAEADDDEWEEVSDDEDEDDDDEDDDDEEEVIEVDEDEDEGEGSMLSSRLRGIFRKKKKETAEQIKLSDMMHGPKSFYFRPPPHGKHGEEEEWTLGYVRRYVGICVTAWHFHKQNGEFMMAASMNSDATGVCIFSKVNNTFRLSDIRSIPRKPSSPVYLGVMQYTFSGRHFTIFDYRVSNPDAKKHRTHQIHDTMHLRYETNVLARVPNAMKVIVARHDEHDALKANWKSLSDRMDELAVEMVRKEEAAQLKLSKKGETDKDAEDLEVQSYGALGVREESEVLCFQTKQPVWNEELQAWTLNFDGRVKMASKKNFLLEVEDKFHLVNEFGEDTEQLRFGKVRKNVYSLDYKYPFCPINALGVAISTFAKKMMVT